MDSVSTDKQLEIPEEVEFEDFCLEFFRELWKDPKTTRFGVSGSAQDGVDVYGLPDGEDGYFGVQCKWKDRSKGKNLSVPNDVYGEVEKAKDFKPKLKEFIIVTTSTRNTKIQQAEREINLDHKTKGLFGVRIMFWEDFENLIPDMPVFRQKKYPYHFGTTSNGSVSTPDQDRKSQNVQLLEDSVSNSNQINVHGDGNSIVINQSSLDDSKVHHAKVDTAKKFLESNNPEQAIVELETLKKEIWGQSDDMIKFRILNNLGVGYAQIGDLDKMTQFFIEALQYNTTDEKALLNSAVAYIYLGQESDASAKVEEVIAKNSLNARAYSLKIELAKDTASNIEEIIALVPKSLLSDNDVANAISRFAKQKRSYNLVDAEKWLRIALENSPNDYETQGALAEVLLQEVFDNPMVLFAQHVDEKDKAKLEESIELFTKAWEKVDGSELKKYKTSWLINRSMARRFVDPKEAVNDIELALKANPKDNKAIRSKAGILFESQKEDEAIKWLEDNQVVLDDDPSLSFMLAGMLRETGPSSKAISVLNDLIEKPNGETEGHDAKRLLIQVYLDEKNYEKAKETRSKIPDTAEFKVLNYIETSRIKFAEGLETEGVKDLLEAKKISEKDTPERQRLELANMLYSYKKYGEASELFEDLIADVADDDITKRFINSLYQDGQYGKALERTSLLKSKIGLTKYIVEVEASIYDDLGDVTKSEEICAEYLDKNQDDKEIRIRLGVTKLRLGKTKEEILETLKPIQNIESLSFSYASQLARLYKDIGEGMRSLELAYEIRRSFHSIPEAHLYYMGIFIDREKENQPYFEKNVIGVDTVVTYKNSTGAQDIFILEDRKNADMRLKEVNKENELFNNLSGKRVGDDIEISPISKEKITVTEIKSKYVYAFQEVMSRYNTMFPSGQGLVGFTFDNSTPEKESESVQKMLDQISSASKQIYAVEDYYNQGQLTIGSFAGVLHKNPIEVFSGLMASQTAKLRVALGIKEEVKESLEYLGLFTIPKLIADITGLISMSGFGIGDMIVKKYEKIGVTQSTVDLITEIIGDNKGAPLKGYVNISKEGDVFVKEEYSAERVASSIAHFEELKKWISENCEVIPVPPQTLGSLEKRKDTERLLGKSFSDTLLISSQKEYVLYSDDERLRSYGKSEYNIRGVWTQLLLTGLLTEKLISDDDYNLAIIKMVNSNYHYTMVNNRVVYRAGKEAKWDIANPMFVKVLDLLSEETTDYLTGGAVAIEFLYLIWADASIPEVDKKKITSHTVSVLTRKKETKIDVLANLKRLITKFFAHKPLIKEQIIAILSS